MLLRDQEMAHELMSGILFIWCIDDYIFCITNCDEAYRGR